MKNENFNCWGFVAHLVGWVDEFCWLEEGAMLELLDAYTTIVFDPRPGDIVAFFENCYVTDTELNHTAIFKKDGLVLHKDGKNPIREELMEIVERKYGNNKVFFRLTNSNPVLF